MLTRLCSLLLLLGLAMPATAGPTPTTTGHPVPPSDLQARFGPRAVVRVNTATGMPQTLRRLDVPTVGATPAARTLDFAARHRGSLIGDAGTSKLVVTDVTARPGVAGRQIVRVAQTLGGLSVVGREMVVVLDATGRVTRVQNDLVTLDPERFASHATRDIGAEAAIAAVTTRFVIAGTGPATKVIVPLPAGAPRVAYQVPAMVLPLTGQFNVWIDAETRETLRWAPVSAHQAIRTLTLREVTP